MNLSQIKKHFTETVQKQYSTAEAEQLWLIFAEKILNKNRVELRGAFEIPSEKETQLRDAVAELLTGKPYQHILGEAFFYGLPFMVNQHVLIPRPETEELVELATDRIRKAWPGKEEFSILDIGTGSGVIPVVLKKTFPQAQVSALDVSASALAVAKKNAAQHQADITFVQGDYLTMELQGPFDLLISNPPYIGLDETTEIAASVRDFEPNLALFSPTEDALVFYRKIATDGLRILNEGGFVCLEINQKFGRETLELFEQYHHKELIKDLSGNDRFIVASP